MVICCRSLLLSAAMLAGFYAAVPFPLSEDTVPSPGEAVSAPRTLRDGASGFAGVFGRDGIRRDGNVTFPFRLAGRD